MTALRALMQQTRLRNVDVAGLGLSPVTVSRILNGRQSGPSAPVLVFALDVLLELERADPARAGIMRRKYGLPE